MEKHSRMVFICTVITLIIGVMFTVFTRTFSAQSITTSADIEVIGVTNGARWELRRYTCKKNIPPCALLHTTTNGAIYVTGASPNTSPVVSDLVISPSSPYTTDDLVASYTFFDVDGDPENGSEIRWYKDGVLQSSYNDVSTVSSNATSGGEEWYFTVKPKDGEDFGTLQMSPSVTIVENTSPVASNLTVSPSSPNTTDDLVGSYTFFDVDGDPENGSEIRWYKDGVLQSAYNNLLTVPSNATAKGETWYFTVKPKDGKDFGTLQLSPSVTIQNSPPTAPVVDVTPNSPVTDDELTCVVTVPSTDPDGDTIQYTYEWYKDDVLQPTETTTTTSLNDTVSSTETVKGQTWKCVVTPNDGETTGPSDQDQVTIDNSPPTASNLTISPSFPRITDNLIGSYDYHDADNDEEINSEIKWYKDGVLQPIYNNLLTVPSAATAKGEIWYFTVRPKDGVDFGVVRASTAVTIQNTSPVASNLTITPSFPQTGDDLVGNYTFFDVDGDPESGSQIRWYKDGVLQSAYNDVSTVSSNATSGGEEWYFTVKPKDGEDFGALQLSPSVTIVENTSPVASNLTISPSFPNTTDNLVGNYSYFDVDGDPENGSEIRWYRDGVLQSGYNDVSTVTSSATAKGEIWYFTVRPKDGVDFGVVRASTAVIIQNTFPVASDLVISPSSPNTTDDLVGNYSYFDVDGDPESGSEIRWYRDSVLQSVYNDLLTVPSSETVVGEEWYFTVKPKDGEDFGALQLSPSVTIVENTPPVASNLTISPSFPYATDDLVAVYSYFDVDGDPESGSEIRWYKDGVFYSAYDIVPSSATAKGQIWYFTVKPKDGKDFGILQTSPSVTIRNSAPVASGLSINPSFPNTTDDLVAVYSYFDVDGDPESGSEIRWRKDGIIQENYSNLMVIPSNATSEGEVWYFTVYPKDGISFGGLSISPSVTIQGIGNIPPVVSNLTLSPSSPYTTDDLVAGYSYFDVDGDPESGSEIRWYKDDALQLVYNDLLTVPSNATAKGETWCFTIKPKDGVDFGTLQVSPSVTIRNTPPTIDSHYPRSNPTINEEESQEFNITKYDTDNDILAVAWYLNGTETGETSNSYTYIANLGSEGTYNVTVTVSDGSSQTQHEWILTVLEKGELWHDLAVINVTSSKTVIGQGYLCNISIEVENQGDFTETFNVTVHANVTEIVTELVTLTEGNSTTIELTWNSTDFALGTYVISAYAHPVPGETDIADNSLADGTVKVTIPGDINGDGEVDWKDLRIFALAYGSSEGEPAYVAEADYNGDGTINWRDLRVLALNYGKTC